MTTKFGLKERSNPPFASYDANKRYISSRTSSVTIYYYHWDKENFGTSTNVQTDEQLKFMLSESTKCTVGKIEEAIESCTVSKNIEQPSASFNFSLFPTKNWKQEISPGDWILVYFHSSLEKTPDEPTSTQGLVLIGNVDRIARVIQKDDETDTTTLRYTVSGRNFGKVFEQTDIWYDPYTTQEATLDIALRTNGLELVGNPTKQVNAAIDVFLGKGGQFGDKKTSPLGQWILPSRLVRLFGSSSSTSFESILRREIQEKLPGFKPRNMTTPNSNGSLWETLKRSSNDIINGLYLEEVRYSDGTVKPTIILKPRPYQTPFFTATKADTSQYGKDDSVSKAALNGAYKSLQDLSRESYVEILQSEIIFENLGRDDHSRINMLWFTTTLEYQYLLNSNSNLAATAKGSISNPTFSRPSIMRHGLRRMDTVLEFCHVEGPDGIAVKGPQRNIDLFKSFAGQLYDMNYANHLYEQGTIECTGVLEAELGKALVITGKGTTKIFFIEGYEHKWHFPNAWTTIFTVSKGQFRNDESALNIFIDVADDDYGSPDASLDFTYIAKTDVTGKK